MEQPNGFWETRGEVGVYVILLLRWNHDLWRVGPNLLERSLSIVDVIATRAGNDFEPPIDLDQ